MTLEATAAKALDALEKALATATPPMWYPVGRMTEEESLQIGGVDPHITSDNGTTVADYISERNAECASIAVNLSAPLAAVARAALERPWIDATVYAQCMSCRAPDGDVLPNWRPTAHKQGCPFAALDAALDAFNAAAREGGAT